MTSMGVPSGDTATDGPGRGGAPRRAGRFETLGAWLHLWTPPRDVAVPPVPVRKLLLGGLAAAILLGVAAALIVPQIEHGKDVGAREQARRDARLAAAERARLRADQRLRRAAGPAGASRAELVDALTRAIDADARARVRAGTLTGTIRRTACSDYRPGGSGAPPVSNRGARIGRYECLVVLEESPRTAGTAAGALGYPFWAKVDFARGTFAWCKVNPRPGEGAAAAVLAVVPLARACNLTKP